MTCDSKINLLFYDNRNPSFISKKIVDLHDCAITNQLLIRAKNAIKVLIIHLHKNVGISRSLKYETRSNIKDMFQTHRY